MGPQMMRTLALWGTSCWGVLGLRGADTRLLKSVVRNQVTAMRSQHCCAKECWGRVTVLTREIQSDGCQRNSNVCVCASMPLGRPYVLVASFAVSDSECAVAGIGRGWHCAPQRTSL
jgi:hypothetical protein